MSDLDLRSRPSRWHPVLIRHKGLSSMNGNLRSAALVALGLLFSATIVTVGTAALFRGRQCVDADVPKGPKEFITYEQTIIPPGTNCSYYYADGSNVVISYPLLTAQWIYLFVLLLVASLPWLLWWIKVRRAKRQ